MTGDKKKIVAIIQARLSSSRFPKKVLRTINGKTILMRVVERLQACQFLEEIIIATTEDDVDDELVEYCQQHHLTHFRGDRDDVLSRFYECATVHGASDIVRVTSDNPLIEPEVVDKTIDLFFRTGADYAANNIIKSFPHGLDVEVFQFKALELSHWSAKNPADREHVTQYIRRNKNIFHLENFVSDYLEHNIRLTVDEPEDYELICLIIRLLGEDARVDAIRQLFKEFPSLRNINSQVADKHYLYNKNLEII
jgi:spore coat polysaccharide biosynthesis protein SpsF